LVDIVPSNFDDVVSPLDNIGKIDNGKKNDWKISGVWKINMRLWTLWKLSLNI
jgi:hypothetical protein